MFRLPVPQLIAGVCLGLAAGLPLVPAQTALVSFSGAGTGTIRTDGNLTLGFSFTVGSQPIVLSALGVWDRFGDGLNSSHEVGVWQESNSTALGTVTVPAGTAAALTGEFRYVNLSVPVTLQANTNYRLGAWFDNVSLEPFLDTGSGTVSNAVYASAISTGLPVYNSGGSLAYPGSGVVYTNGYTGPGALFTVAVPEPAGGALAGAVGVLGLTWCRRRRR